MSTINSIFFFDKFENKFVFKVSRTFFWIFTALAILTVVVSALSFIYSVIPPIKESVTMKPLPGEPTIAYQDVLNEITPPVPSTQPSPNYEQTPQTEQQQNYSASVPRAKSELEILYDSLGTFFPGVWEGVYQDVPSGRDFFGRITGYQKVLVRQGLKNEVQYSLNRIQGDPSKTSIIKNMLAIIPKFENSKRERALYIYLNLLRGKWYEYNNQIEQIKYEYGQQMSLAETKYFTAKAEKEELESKAVKGLGGGIVLIALLGLILSFLAIERNTRTIRELIEKGKMP